MTKSCFTPILPASSCALFYTKTTLDPVTDGAPNSTNSIPCPPNARTRSNAIAQNGSIGRGASMKVSSEVQRRIKLTDSPDPPTPPTESKKLVKGVYVVYDVMCTNII